MKKLLLFTLILTGCKARKVENYVAEKKSDSLYLKIETVTAPALADVLTINDVCDTVTNTVTKFKRVLVVDNDSLEILTSENNELKVRLIRQEAEVLRLEQKHRDKSSTAVAVAKELRYRVDWRLVVVALFGGGFLGYFKVWRYI